jgi:hypothetical protein
MRRFLLAMTVMFGVAVLPKAAEAGLITGSLDIAGGIVVDADSADWFRSVNPNLNPNEAIVIGNQLFNGGVLAPIPAGSLVHETNLNFNTAIPGTTLNIDLFEFPLAAPNIDFVLTHVDTCAELGGTYQCFGASPFGFIQNTTSVTIALQLRGTVHDTATPGLVSTWSGLWTTNVNGTIAQIFGIIEGGGAIATSYSATKIVVAPPAGVPEPATLLTFGAGSAILARMRRRKMMA